MRFRMGLRHGVAIAASTACLVFISDLALGIANRAMAAAPRETDDPSDSLTKIEGDYQEQLLKLDRTRLERLTRLAASQPPAEAASTYVHLFQLAISGNLFLEAEPAALTLVSKGAASVEALAMAHLVKIIAECDRGAFDQSVESLRTFLDAKGKDSQLKEAGAHLFTNERIQICDLYYQRLIHADQFEVARKALNLLKSQAQDPELAAFLTNRLARLDTVGKPAPALKSRDLDGKEFDLSAARGKVVLLIYWATWSVPSETELTTLLELDAAYRGKGLQIVAINVDAMQEQGVRLDSVAPAVKRFLLDHNVSWPNLISSPENDLTRAFGVTEIPASVLVDRAGNVASIDLVRRNLEPSIARLIAR